MSKTDSGGTTSYKRAGATVTDSLLKSTVSSTTTDYTPGVSSRVSGTSTFDHSGIKNADTQTDDGGDVSAMRRYDAFGNPLAAWGGWQGPFGYGGPYGYQTDPDHGLMLLGHRYYEADTGRFLTRDPIKDGRNWYAYCDGCPITRRDMQGLDWHDPTRVKVSRRFKGKVWAIGETGPDNVARRTRVGPGQITHPAMDVDYITVVLPDGTQKSYFLPGVTKYLGSAGPNQTYRIDADGTVHWDLLQDWNTFLNGWPPIQVEGPGKRLDVPFNKWQEMREESRRTVFPKDRAPGAY